MGENLRGSASDSTALQVARAVQSLDELIAALTSRDDSAAESAVHELKEQGAAGTSVLVELLESKDPEHRWWAVRALAATPGPQTAWFVRALEDPETEVRAAAALALAAHPDEAATAPLVSALSDVDGLVAVLAVHALVRAGNSAVPLLVESYEKAPARGRIHILRALAELRDPRAIKLMMIALETNSAALQYWAREGLERLGLDMVYLMPD